MGRFADGWRRLAGWAMAAGFAAAAIVPAAADTLYLKNGNIVHGRILSEDEQKVVINTGVVELQVARGEISRMAKGLPTEFLRTAASSALQRAAQLHGKGDSVGALKVLQAAMAEFDATVEEAGAQVPADMAELRRQLEAQHKTYIPKDEDSLAAEAMFAQATALLDKVEYEKALPLLKEAGRRLPDRADVQLRLAETAQRMNDGETATEAYRALLDLDAEAYYGQAAGPLVQLLESKARRLLNQRRADDAVDVYRDLLLLRGANEGQPATLAEFVARQTLRREKSEDEILMEVYRYADGNDLVDLAFAAISKVAVLKPDDAEVASLKKSSEYLAKLKDLVADGKVEDAAKLMTEAREALPDAAEFQKKADALAGALDAEVEAARLLGVAKDAAAKEDFAGARETALKVATDHSESKAAIEARELVAACDREIPMKGAMEAATKRLEDRDYDGASAEIDKALARENAKQSRYFSAATALKQRIPDEKEADRLYDLAQVLLERDDFDEALARLEELESRYAETASGKKAAEWLRRHRNRLATEALKEHLVESQSFFAFADPSLWRAAAMPDVAAGGAKVPPVESAHRDAAWRVFGAIRERDVPAERELAPAAAALGIPIGAGLALMAGLVLLVLAPGKGKFPHEAEGEPNGKDSSCRMCGQGLKEGEFACGACGESRASHDVEDERLESSRKKADYDPWEVRVKSSSANDFEKHYQKARDLAETSDAQAAIEHCRLALREDPLRKKGYELLASLYERIGQRDEATKCYREVLLIDPADAEARTKIESLLKLSASPLSTKPAMAWGSAALWWMAWFAAMAIDAGAGVLRAAACAAGAGLTFVLWDRVQRRRKAAHTARKGGALHAHRPLPTEPLSFAEQSRQAKYIAQATADHTGMEVPALGPWRPVAAAAASLLLLAGLALLAWRTESWWFLAAWPAGALVFFHVLEVHPRALAAHVLLRHFFEETLSTWVDPHRPFVPKGTAAKGEFLIAGPQEFPLAWALKPLPYARNRQGVLNSLQQTLNRHWAFHRFYDGAKVVRDIDVPMPAGAGAALGAALLLTLAIWAGAAMAWSRQAAAEKGYDDALKLGYGYLLDGNVGSALDEFRRAARLKPSRVVPALYAAHANAAAGMDGAAERAFRSAAEKPTELAETFNDFGNFLQRKGRLDEAAREYERATRVDPNNADVYNNLGSVHFKLKENAKAIETLERAVRLNPSHSRAHTTLGLALEAAGRDEEARAAFREAIRVAPDEPYTQVARDRLDNPEAGELVLGDEAEQ